MAEMTLSRALKHKNRVAEKIRRISEDMRSHNSILEVNEPEVDVRALDGMRRLLTDHLISVKTTIHVIVPENIRAKIFRLGELKATIGFYRGLDTSHGKRQSSRYSMRPSDEFVENKAVIRKEEVDRIVIELEKEIDRIQDELDEFNARTKVSIVIPEAMDRPFAPMPT